MAPNLKLSVQVSLGGSIDHHPGDLFIYVSSAMKTVRSNIFRLPQHLRLHEPFHSRFTSASLYIVAQQYKRRIILIQSQELPPTLCYRNRIFLVTNTNTFRGMKHASRCIFLQWRPNKAAMSRCEMVILKLPELAIIMLASHRPVQSLTFCFARFAEVEQLLKYFV